MASPGSNIGYERENLVHMTMKDRVAETFDLLKVKLDAIPEVTDVTASNGLPINHGFSTSNFDWEGKDPDADLLAHIFQVNYNFTGTYNMEIKLGRDFDPEILSDSSGYIINEAMMKLMGAENPVGEDLTLWSKKGKIIGVVNDFNYKRMTIRVEPMIMKLSTGSADNLAIRINGLVRTAISSIETVWKEVSPDMPFNYAFLDNDFEKLYRSESRMSGLFIWFAILGITVSCLGLFGLASFIAEQRKKEIGIRKSLGASIEEMYTIPDST